VKKVVLAIFAHPDDAEFMCAGTLSLLRKAGWTIHIGSLTPGDKGTTEYSGKEISIIRKAEASKSVELLDGAYHCLDLEDIYILYGYDAINKTTALIRRIRPSIVFTASPNDYMVDHEITSKIVQTACFSSGIKNMEIFEEPLEPTPYLYYCDPMEGKDKLGNPVNPTIYTDISEEIFIKEQMLACHKSQRNWLITHHNIDEYLQGMKSFAKQRGNEIGTKFAEGFRQHLGHAYPQENILKKLLNDLVIVIEY
jgi:LmbE family N-acetylglucosaminyl deacetylase